jgi:hypothetical protein
VPASHYRLEHDIRLVRTAPNRWALADATVESDGALPPLTQPHLQRAGRTLTASGGSALGPGSSTDRDPAAVLRRSRAAASRYNHDEIIRYSIMWWDGRNPIFPTITTSAATARTSSRR